MDKAQQRELDKKHYWEAVEETARNLLWSIDFDDGRDVDETFEEELNERGKGFVFDTDLSEEESAFICLAYSNYPSEGIFQGNAKCNSPREDFPFASLAVDAFIEDVREWICNVVDFSQDDEAIARSVFKLNKERES